MKSHLQADLHLICILLQISVKAHRGTNENAFIAVDEFAFLQDVSCEALPKEAKPTEPPTTPEPTEPPGRKIFFFFRLFRESHSRSHSLFSPFYDTRLEVREFVLKAGNKTSLGLLVKSTPFEPDISPLAQ